MLYRSHLVGIETVGSCSVNRGQHDDISCQTKLMPSNRMIDAAACTADNQSLLFGVRTNYCETKYPPKKFIPLYYFFERQKQKSKIEISI